MKKRKRDKISVNQSKYQLTEAQDERKAQQLLKEQQYDLQVKKAVTLLAKVQAETKRYNTKSLQQKMQLVEKLNHRLFEGKDLSEIQQLQLESLFIDYGLA